VKWWHRSAEPSSTVLERLEDVTDELECVTTRLRARVQELQVPHYTTTSEPEKK
jgi:hypothetical protein